MQRLFDLFDKIGKPYFRQGSLSDEDYQPEFFTFWNIDTPQDSHYDNQLHAWNEYIQIGYYTNDANKIISGMDNFVAEAKKTGFIIAALPRDANADKPGYFGRVCHIRIKEQE